MINIRPVSDLRNKFPEIEELVINSSKPVFLTKNGHGSMVLLSIEQYAALTDNLEFKFDEADRTAQFIDTRHTGKEMFAKVRKRING